MSWCSSEANGWKCGGNEARGKARSPKKASDCKLTNTNELEEVRASNQSGNQGRGGNVKGHRREQSYQYSLINKHTKTYAAAPWKLYSLVCRIPIVGLKWIVWWRLKHIFPKQGFLSNFVSPQATGRWMVPSKCDQNPSSQNSCEISIKGSSSLPYSRPDQNLIIKCSRPISSFISSQSFMGRRGKKKTRPQ